MRITPEWLAETDHCADGRAFGETMIPPAGLEIEECWPLLDRPDWVVSFAVKTEAILYDDARRIVEAVLRFHIQEAGDKAAESCLDCLRRSSDNAKIIADAASLAYEMVAVRRDLASAHRLNAIGQLAGADMTSKVFSDLALSRVQGAAFSLGLAMGHVCAAALLKARVFNAIDAKRRVHV